jgi:hemolysin III
MLVTLRDGNGPVLLGIVWSVAILGLLIDVLNPRRIEVLQITIYLIMGWMCTFDFSSLQAAFPVAGIIWLTLGGISYTLGIVFYVLDKMNRLRHAHGIWHLFVLLGSISHFISIIVYVR